jgi:predicted transcriptional regulator
MSRYPAVRIKIAIEAPVQVDGNEHHTRVKRYEVFSIEPSKDETVVDLQASFNQEVKLQMQLKSVRAEIIALSKHLLNKHLK